MSENNVLKAEENAKLSLESGSHWSAIAMIAAGIILLLANLFNFHLISLLWPGFIIGPGLLMMWPAYRETDDHQSFMAYLAVPGAVVTMVGLMLFVMNLTGAFEAWAYVWTLLPAAAAAGMMYVKRFDTASKVHETGRKFIKAMVMLCGAFAIFFELIIFQSYRPWLPLLMIGYGIYLLVQNRRQDA